MEIKRPVKWAIIGGLLGGAVGAAYFLIKQRKEGSDAVRDNPDIAYTYEEAVKKAREKLQNGNDEGVKLVPHQDVPDLDAEIEMKTAYHKISEEYVTTTEDNDAGGKTVIIEEGQLEIGTSEQAVEEDPLAGLEPWPDNKVGKYIRISEDKFRYENPFNTKLLGAYFPKDGKIGGWDDKLEPIEDDELIRRMHAICQSEDFDGNETYFFSDPDEGIDYEIEINEYRWQEAYEDYKQGA